MRKGIDGLSGNIIGAIDEDPQSGYLFVFLTERRNRIRARLWEGSELRMLNRRLEQDRFQVFDRESEALDIGSALGRSWH